MCPLFSFSPFPLFMSFTSLSLFTLTYSPFLSFPLISCPYSISPPLLFCLLLSSPIFIYLLSVVSSPLLPYLSLSLSLFSSMSFFPPFFSFLSLFPLFSFLFSFLLVVKLFNSICNILICQSCTGLLDLSFYLI